MIRLLHTSDWHLGRVLHGKSLIEDQNHILEQLLMLIDETKPHALLIAGDVFDRPLPPESAVSLFNHFLNEAVGKRNLPVFLIPGNHDSCERLGFAAQLLRNQNVTIFSRIEDSFAPITIIGENDLSVSVYGIPFVEPMMMAKAMGVERFDNPNDATRAVCEKILREKPADRHAVLLCHAFVAGGEVSDSEKEIFIGGSSTVDVKCFEGFAYTALGHLHKPQSAGHDRVRYSGSLFSYSKSEVKQPKSITEVRIQPDGAVELNFHELKTLRSLRYVEGELDSLIEAGKSDSKADDYIIAGFTDTGAVLDAYAKLRAVYPNLLHIARAGGFTPDQAPSLSRARERENLSELDLFAEFFSASTGTELDASEREALIEVIKEVAESERNA